MISVRDDYLGGPDDAFGKPRCIYASANLWYGRIRDIVDIDSTPLVCDVSNIIDNDYVLGWPPRWLARDEYGRRRVRDVDHMPSSRAGGNQRMVSVKRYIKRNLRDGYIPHHRGESGIGHVDDLKA